VTTAGELKTVHRVAQLDANTLTTEDQKRTDNAEDKREDQARKPRVRFMSWWWIMAYFDEQSEGLAG